MNKVKALSLLGAIGLTLYGGAVYTFSQKANQFINSFSDCESGERVTQFTKDRFSVNAYRFEICFFDKEKKQKQVSLQLNPFSNTLHAYALSTIDETFNFKTFGTLGIKLTPEQKVTLISFKLRSSVFNIDLSKGFINMILDEDIVLADMNIHNEKYKIDINPNFKNEKLGKEIITSMSFDIKTNESELTYRDGVLNGKADIELSYENNLKIKDVNHSVSESSIPVRNILNIIKIILKEENTKEIQKQDKGELFSNILECIKKTKLVAKSDRKGSDPSNNEIIYNSATSCDIYVTKPNHFLMSIDDNSDVDFVRLSGFIKNVTNDPEFQLFLKGDEVKVAEKVLNKYKKANFKSFLNVEISGDKEGNVFENSESLQHFFDTDDLKGDYKANATFKIDIENCFSLKVLFDGKYSGKPSGTLKVVLPKSSYQSLLNFVEDVKQMSKGTTVDEYLRSIDLKTLPYEQFFKLEKDEKTGEEAETFTFSF